MLWYRLVRSGTLVGYGVVQRYQVGFDGSVGHGVSYIKTKTSGQPRLRGKERLVAEEVRVQALGDGHVPVLLRLEVD
jgi:hypothetical protein